METWQLDIKPDSLQAIMSKEKLFEGIVPDGTNPKKDYRDIKAGDKLEFYLVNEKWIRAYSKPSYVIERVLSVNHYNSVEDACWDLEEKGDLDLLNPGLDIGQNIELYNGFPGYPERIDEYGFVLIQLWPKHDSPCFV